MIKKYGFLLFTGIFVISLTLIFGQSYFKKNISKESGRFNIDLNSDHAMLNPIPVEYDIQNENVEALQNHTGKMSILTGNGSRISNSGNQPIWLAVKAVGVEGVKVLSHLPYFQGSLEYSAKPLMPGEVLDVNVNIDLSNEALYSYIVGKGSLEFYDYKRNQKLGVIPIKVINSKPQKSCCGMEK